MRVLKKILLLILFSLFLVPNAGATSQMRAEIKITPLVTPSGLDSEGTYQIQYIVFNDGFALAKDALQNDGTKFTGNITIRYSYSFTANEPDDGGSWIIYFTKTLETEYKEVQVQVPPIGENWSNTITIKVPIEDSSVYFVNFDATLDVNMLNYSTSVASGSGGIGMELVINTYGDSLASTLKSVPINNSGKITYVNQLYSNFSGNLTKLKEKVAILSEAGKTPKIDVSEYETALLQMKQTMDQGDFYGAAANYYRNLAPINAELELKIADIKQTVQKTETTSTVVEKPQQTNIVDNSRYVYIIGAGGVLIVGLALIFYKKS